MKIKAWFKNLDYRHYICTAITTGFIAVAIFVFPWAFTRVLESLRDFGRSFAFYFCRVFGINEVQPSINALSKMPIQLPNGFPETWEDFQAVWHAYWEAFANKDNFIGYWSSVGNVARDGSRVLLILVPVLVVLIILFKRVLESQNNKYGEDTRHLKRFKKISAVTYRPAKLWCLEFWDFLVQHRGYWIAWLCIWAYAFNLFVIVIEFLAWYFYFCVSFDVANIYRQIYKLVVDLSVPLTFIPIAVWVFIAIGVLCVVRRKIAYARLNHFEMKNRGFINARPIVYMIVGTMGTGKTTCDADMALSCEVMFRDKALELLLENDLRFPYFPWIKLENCLRAFMDSHEVYNLATCKKFVRYLHYLFDLSQSLDDAGKKSMRRHFSRKHGFKFDNDFIFGYDYKQYGLTSCDDLSVKDLWSVLESYVQLYFIYIVQSSLIIGNYSIRTDNIISDIGNFPLWDTNFFKRDARLIEAYSRHAHILDFDMLRLGKRLVEENEKSDMFEFGIIPITEIGKERGNNLELKEIKKCVDEANQKNDLFNSWLKMVRHSATVDGYPFVKVITDEQRPESWGADARDLSEIVRIVTRSERKLAMPLFALEELLHTFVFSKFTDLYYQHRYQRGDNTLTMYIFKTICAKFHDYYVKTYNRFGYMVCDVEVESGTQDGSKVPNKYYLMTKKIYSRRFSTDCFSEFFSEKALRTAMGLDDLREFESEKATFEEMLQENSYFFGDLCRMLKSDETEGQVKADIEDKSPKRKLKKQ